MGGIEAITQRSVQNVTGEIGLKKYIRAMSDRKISGLTGRDGSPDFVMLMNLLLDIFPEASASAIMDEVLVQYSDVVDSGSSEAVHAAHTAPASAGSPGPDSEEEKETPDPTALKFILIDTISGHSGKEGVDRFMKKVSDQRIADTIKKDRSVELFKLMNLLLDIFPEDIASGIMDDTVLKYNEALKHITHKPGLAALRQSRDQSAANRPEAVQRIKVHKVTNGADTVKTDPVSVKYAQFFNTEVSEVQDMINEARRIRAAMGKLGPEPAPPEMNPVDAYRERQAVSEETPVTAKINSPEIAEEKPALSEPAPIPILDDQHLDMEIMQFIRSHKSPSSIDILDFTRYLKEKGYSIQENTILEKVYITIEEQKSKARTKLVREIRIFLDSTAWPSESDVTSFIEELKQSDTIYDEAEIKQMILKEMMHNT